MIQRIEELVKTKFEERVLQALPELAVMQASPVPGAPASIVTRIESRRPTRCVQEEPGVKRYGEVEATLSATIYNRGQDFIDKSALLASFMEDPFLYITDWPPIRCELEESELAEGPHLDADVWLFTVTYPVIDITDENASRTAAISGENALAAAELYPAESPSDYGPEEHFK